MDQGFDGFVASANGNGGDQQPMKRAHFFRGKLHDLCFGLRLPREKTQKGHKGNKIMRACLCAGAGERPLASVGSQEAASTPPQFAPVPTASVHKVCVFVSVCKCLYLCTCVWFCCVCP